MMDARNLDSLAERGEFYLCLARAFLTPLQPQAFDALRDALADDLAELGGSLGFEFAEELADYRRAIAAVPGRAALLQLYSRLFIAPPRSIQINTGGYLDGAINGGSVAAMEDAYRRCGVERGAGFHDLSDHLSVQLEFVALLYFLSVEAIEAGTPLPEVRPEHFLHDFVARWLPPFIRDLEHDAEDRGAPANPYLPLARILAAAVARDAVAPPIPDARRRAHRAITKARHDRAVRGVTAEDMEFIARRLREKGLSTDHLAIPPELRDEAQGLTRKQPPSPRSGSRYG
jgi:TorA maturation chaperone TorD